MEAKKRIWKGNPVSAGMALAKTYLYHPLELTVTEAYFSVGEEAQQLRAFHDARTRAGAELDTLYAALSREDESKAKIFAAHKEILEDEEILEEMQMAIEDDRLVPEYAIEKVFTEFAELLAKVDNPLIAGRAADLQDVKKRLLRVYFGKEEKNLAQLSEDVIVVAHDLLPSDTATMDRTHVKGIVTEIGGSNSHSAILARSFRIPAVLGVADAMTKLPDGAWLAMDGLCGELILEPTEKEMAENAEKQQQFLKKREEEERYRNRPCVMTDGTELHIGINVGSPGFEAEEQNFDFVGLFRTEFLYMENTALPTEEEQFAAYKKVLEQAKGHPVTLRTLDIGGDKTLPYMQLPKEENPFLGKRALRLCLSKPEIFMTQLRAALRASAFGPLQIMFPMVGSMEDIARVKEFMGRAREELRSEGKDFDEKVKIGVMIEIPSLALIADMVAAEVDFASIGSNDLTQYVSAADRMNPEITEYYQNYSPAMLRLLKMIFEAFERQGKEVSVCGEMAGNPAAAVLLAGLGAKKLSMSMANVAAVKAALAGSSFSDAKALADRCCQTKTETEIKMLLGMR